MEYFQPPRFNYLVGTFLDIGANDGVTFSNSFALVNLGWSGVCVEPSPAAFAKLSSEHKEYQDDLLTRRIRCVNAAITTTDGPIDLYDSGTHLKKGDVALLSTTVPAEVDRWKKSGEQFTKTTVRGITFDTLMRETAQTRFDFVSIDAEGADLAILRQMDLTAIGCQLLCIECNQRKDDEAAMIAHCAGHGMKLHHRTYENLIFSKA